MSRRPGVPIRAWVAAAWLCALPALALAQPGGAPASPPAPTVARADSPATARSSAPTLMERQHIERRAQVQLILRDCDDMLEKVRETNRWMEQSRASDPYRALGAHLEGSVMQVRDATRAIDRLCDDPALQKDKDRLRDLDRLKENLRLLLRVHDRSHLALRKLVRMP